jgi:transcriptional regulator with XRE-family HTH domain
MPSNERGRPLRPIGRELTLADQLREAIERSGLSGKELALRAEIDSGQLSRFRSGERDLMLETAGYLCNALGLALAEVSRGRGRPPKVSKTERADLRGKGQKPAGNEGEVGSETERSGDQEVWRDL